MLTDKHYSVLMSTYGEEIENAGRVAYRQAYTTRDNPHPRGTAMHRAWDKGFWAEHDDAAMAAPIEETSGMEEGYGDYWDTDAVSQGYYDDDPNPYDGTCSEE